MRVKQLLIAAMGLALAVPSIASAQFSEDFDAYATGTSMHGVNGWKGWDNNPAATAFTSDAQAQSAPNSVAIGPTSDLVHEFFGYTTGAWVVRIMQYIPSSTIGQQYFLLLNEYNDGGPYNWSTQIQFLDGLLVINDGDGTSTPIIANQWIEIRVEIDLDANSQTIYYDGALLAVSSWTEGITGGGSLNIGAVDLFSNGATEIYYDDFSIESANPTPIIDSSWGEIKATFK